MEVMCRIFYNTRLNIMLIIDTPVTRKGMFDSKHFLLINKARLTPANTFHLNYDFEIFHGWPIQTNSVINIFDCLTLFYFCGSTNSEAKINESIHCNDFYTLRFVSKATQSSILVQATSCCGGDMPDPPLTSPNPLQSLTT